jgi:hypothetical protein
VLFAILFDYSIPRGVKIQVKFESLKRKEASLELHQAFFTKYFSKIHGKNSIKFNWTNKTAYYVEECREVTYLKLC